MIAPSIRLIQKFKFFKRTFLLLHVMQCYYRIQSCVKIKITLKSIKFEFKLLLSDMFYTLQMDFYSTHTHTHTRRYSVSPKSKNSPILLVHDVVVQFYISN